MKAFWYLGLFLLTSVAVVTAAESGRERELIEDNHFRRGFILHEPKPGKHVRYGESKGFESTLCAIERSSPPGTI